ncbi:MAG: hypothetical protein LKM32_09335 [Chiayiivirga sp.]|jgi:hypothetical protein|uniref:hypothetical protein n=1 Tax=Chiayiivirga sp. TaxID=2041042 RepID=UPI0025BD9D01|nr:hypothetical protein [Chiayiivirga sp.]MCI1711854.1 hypothetical protein [Chiayiivirga sp.]MCI1729557.1 hypothetical protein [Chiayiivirga sp.]
MSKPDEKTVDGNINLREERIQELADSIAARIPATKQATAAAQTAHHIPADKVDELRSNNWVCDYETHRLLWETQAMLRLIGDAFPDSSDGMDGTQSELLSLATQGVERLLAGAIRRTSWSPIGWGNRE